ncbi:MAG: TVP38/TMEM64 family protein [Verrucomicrobiales bacterium]
MQKLKKILTHPAFLITAGVGALLCVAAVVVAIQMGVTVEMAREQFDRLLDGIRDKPILLFVAMAILPAFPVPISPMLLAVGAVFKPIWGGPFAFAYALSAVIVNMSWVWWAAAYPGRKVASDLLKKCDITLPEPDKKKGYIPLLIFLRITPGFPLFLQNLILGFVRVPFIPYILISSALTSIYTFGFVILGGAIFEGEAKIALLAVAVILLGIIITSYLRKKAPPVEGLQPRQDSEPSNQDGSHP